MTVSERAAVSSAVAEALGRVEGIYIASGASAPMQPLDRVRAIAGVGLEGDRYALGNGTYSPIPADGRHATLIDAAQIEALGAEHGIELPVGEARRNLVTRGVDLPALVGQRLWIGEVLCVGTRECLPCAYLEAHTARPGLLKALVNRGGLRLEILQGGSIRVGDAIRLAE